MPKLYASNVFIDPYKYHQQCKVPAELEYQGFVRVPEKFELSDIFGLPEIDGQPDIFREIIRPEIMNSV